jgi:hypothetical protein
MVMRTIWAGLAIFITWSILDFFLHRLLLRGPYEATAHLWRPTNQMNLPLIYVVMAVLIVCFVLIYALLVKEKSLTSGIRFGALFGLAISVSVGFGTYIHMPIPLTLAWGWFLGGWIKAIAAGAVVGALVK